MRNVQFLSSVADQVATTGRLGYPYECCGVLLGRDLPDGNRLIDRVVDVSNDSAAEHRNRRFAIDGMALARIERSASSENRSVVGFYHTHPDAPAVPSEFDRNHVPHWEFYTHAIVSILGGLDATMRCWSIDESRAQFREELFQLIHTGREMVPEPAKSHNRL